MGLIIFQRPAPKEILGEIWITPAFGARDGIWAANSWLTMTQGFATMMMFVSIAVPPAVVSR